MKDQKFYQKFFCGRPPTETPISEQNKQLEANRPNEIALKSTRFGFRTRWWTLRDISAFKHAQEVVNSQMKRGQS